MYRTAGTAVARCPKRNQRHICRGSKAKRGVKVVFVSDAMPAVSQILCEAPDRLPYGSWILLAHIRWELWNCEMMHLRCVYLLTRTWWSLGSWFISLVALGTVDNYSLA